MRLIAITGAIACGKSAFSACLPPLGGEVLDTDSVVHALEAPGGAAVAPILAAFGAAFARADGAVDRPRLAAHVFADPAALRRLNAIVHPLVETAVRQWLATPPPPATAFRAVQVPLLFAAGWHRRFPWHAIIALTCDRAARLDRLQRRGLTPAAAAARLAAQAPPAAADRQPDYLIDNNGSLADLARLAKATIDKILEREP